MTLRLLALGFCLWIAFPAQAGNIMLNADEKVEYHQNEQKLVAVGNAVASKDDMSIRADKLVGYYAPKTKNKISKVEAFDNVKMHSTEADAFGSKMIYDVAADTVVLTGAPAKIKLPDAEITAEGSITYYQTQQKAVATKNVIATDAKGSKVYANLMTAYFTKDKEGKLSLDKIDIEDDVKIINKDATVTALKGTYFASSGKIKLFEDIVINQNGNILKGAEAETNLNTGVSKLLSGGKKGRVSGIFKEKKKD